MSDALASPRHLRALLTEFDAVLSAEYDALRERNADGLDAAIARKQRLAHDIEVVTTQVTPPATPDPELLEEWSEIRTLLGRCALANRTNGAAIDASRSFVTSMLDILTGRNVRERTYTARGRLAPAVPHATYERV
ncbi:MAG: flagellar protein FlgN [Gammaproteobacteria bacterium]|nr:flagellar protein FlgN [Gammaproteobacteria bacterium]